MQTRSNPNAVLPEAPESNATFEPAWNENPAREQILPRLRLLWGMRRFLFRCALVGFFVATLIAFLIPSEYESTARLMPPDSPQGGGLALMAMLGGGQSGSPGLGSLATDLLGAKTTGAMFIAVMHSRTAEDSIIQRFDLKKVYWTRLEQSARKRLERNTDISEERKSGVITLRVTDHDPKRATAMASAYIEQLDILTAKLNTSAAHRERVFLEDRLNKINVELESAEKDFSQFASKNATIDISAQGRAMVEAAASLQGQLIAAESQLEGLRQIYSDNNIRVRSTQARITELRNQMQKLGGTSAGNAAPASDQSPTDNAYPTLRQLPLLGVPYADKFRQLKVEEAVYETLTKQFELAKVQEAKEIPSVKVLDQPEVPERKSFPPRALIIFLGTACSVLLGAVWVFGTARWRQIDPHDPGMKFAQEVFGTVRAGMPWVSANGSNGHAGANGNSGSSGKQADERSKTASA
jgi:capsule polysaccharide export protein KpsE/RkpR